MEDSLVLAASQEEAVIFTPLVVAFHLKEPMIYLSNSLEVKILLMTSLMTITSWVTHIINSSNIRLDKKSSKSKGSHLSSSPFGMTPFGDFGRGFGGFDDDDFFGVSGFGGGGFGGGGFGSSEFSSFSSGGMMGGGSGTSMSKKTIIK